MLNLVDRDLMGLLLEPIKQDLRLSDTELGFLTGIAFGLFYATLGVPIARWADRGNRVTITSVAIGLWSLTVMACLLVRSYGQLAAARIAAAVGESGCTPPTYSLVGDYFPQPALRARAMAVYTSGNQLAALLSFIVGGWLNQRYGWRMTFFLVGIPGIALAVLLKATVVEPRAAAKPKRLDAAAQVSLGAVLTILWRQRSLRNLTLALILLFTMGAGLSPWYAAFMIRDHGMATGELGIWLGLIFGLGGLAGVMLGGYVVSRWLADDERAQMRVTALTVAAVVPCLVSFLILPDRYEALLALVPLMLAVCFFMGPTYALLQRLVADDMRATVMAIVMLLANLIGMGTGPQLVGMLSDLLHPMLGRESLRDAMLIMSLAAFGAAYHFWEAGRTVKEDLSRPDPPVSTSLA